MYSLGRSEFLGNNPRYKTFVIVDLLEPTLALKTMTVCSMYSNEIMRGN